MVDSMILVNPSVSADFDAAVDAKYVTRYLGRNTRKDVAPLLINDR